MVGEAPGGLSKEKLLELLRAMLLSRRFEEKTAESYQMGKIGGFCHLYIGQEAVAAGAIGALREDDYVIT
ncbi:MAG: thiamine pyrophosphate-dependent enzyme, partial [marine benthic group bacterium]|nr:thiamine pyrophosphate-dependent enzyme [Gemmatimonadota bacterium]